MAQASEIEPAPPAAQAGPVVALPIETIIAQTMPGVVRIEARDGGQSGTGSGFVFDAQGYVLTNAHVVGQGLHFTVRFADGRSEAAELVGKDPRIDVAVLRIAPFRGMTALPPALSTPVMGANAYALGSPMGLPISVSRGIVSGVGRAYDVAWPVNFIQHDAAINPGNSGGPLIDAAGQVLGINTATPPETIFDIGIGLAIPIDVALHTARQLIRDGHMERGALGLMVSAADAEVAQAIGAGANPGLLVDQVLPGSAAQRAGLMAGDLVLTLGEAPMLEPRDLSFRLLDSRPGQTVALQLMRGPRRLVVPVVLQSDDPESGGHERAGKVVASDTALGLEFGASSSPGQVLIGTVAEQSLADRMGIASGDVLLAVNGEVVRSPAQAERLIGGAQSSVLVLRIERKGLGVRHFAVPREPLAMTQVSAARNRSVGPV